MRTLISIAPHDVQTRRMGLAMIGELGSAFTKTGDAGINNAIGMNVQNFDSARQAKDLASDMKRLIASNSCGGAPLKRFERNLIAYSTDKPPIRMVGIPTSGPLS